MADKKEYIERGVFWRNLEIAPDHWIKGRTIKAILDEQPAADVVSKGVYEQVQWERDMAMQQLEEHGIPFGGTADNVVEVVRCKDCKHWTPMDDGISWNNRGRADGRCKMLENMHYSERGLTSEDHFCSYGERKEQT